MTNATQKPRDMFRWAFEEQLGTHLWGSTDSYTENYQKIQAASMDAFDYVWRRYGLEALLISPGRDS